MKLPQHVYKVGKEEPFSVDEDSLSHDRPSVNEFPSFPRFPGTSFHGIPRLRDMIELIKKRETYLYSSYWILIVFLVNEHLHTLFQIYWWEFERQEEGHSSSYSHEFFCLHVEDISQRKLNVSLDLSRKIASFSERILSLTMRTI